ncbi:MAG TPA: mandelate racemase/muconate lactonizing enzyme family protein [Acidimicrobiales bacterium]|nr:mandelate racemase/muconate lactonizing enzyme family protein [Acidimicrobiales bacterium]
MKIVGVDVFKQTYHVEPGPFAMSGGRVVAEQDSTIVRVQTDDGAYGWGEQCSFSPAYIPGHGAATRATVPLLAAAIMGSDPREVEKVHELMDKAVVGQEYAKSALDIACWDLLGRATGLRVSELLGGTWCEEVSLYKAVSLGGPSEMGKRAAEIQAEGYDFVQVKVGDAWEDDLVRITACVDALPGAGQVVIDANGQWPRQDALRAAGHLRELDVYLEQPCSTTRECRAVRQMAGKPMVLDESLTGFPALIDALEAGELDVARLKLSRFGGITPLRKARDLCLAMGVGVSVEDSAGGDIVSAATVHLAASIPDRGRFDAFVPSGEVREHVAQEPVVPRRGRAQVPAGPGLGVEVDLAMLGPPVDRVR